MSPFARAAVRQATSYSIPRAEVFRFDKGKDWTSLRRLFDPKGFAPVPVGSGDAAGVADWSRATSLTVFAGKLFASTGTCYRTNMAVPRADEIRGKVVAFETGANVTHDHDLGPGWKHLAAIRDDHELKLYVNGRLAAASKLGKKELDVSNDVPLRIGCGEHASFLGKIREVRLYNRALSAAEVQRLARDK